MENRPLVIDEQIEFEKEWVEIKTSRQLPIILEDLKKKPQINNEIWKDVNQTNERGERTTSYWWIGSDWEIMISNSRFMDNYRPFWRNLKNNRKISYVSGWVWKH